MSELATPADAKAPSNAILAARAQRCDTPDRSEPRTNLMLDRDAIFRSLAPHTDELRRQGVRRLGLFGSFARGDARPDSDIDFVVDFDHVTFDRYMDVRFLLEDLFGRKIDLVPIDRIKPLVRDRILAEMVDAPGF